MGRLEDRLTDPTREISVFCQSALYPKTENSLQESNRTIVIQVVSCRQTNLTLKTCKQQKVGNQSDVAWSLFRHCLKYKAEEAGIGFKAVDPE